MVLNDSYFVHVGERIGRCTCYKLKERTEGKIFRTFREHVGGEQWAKLFVLIESMWGEGQPNQLCCLAGP